MQVIVNAMMGRGYDATPAIALIINKDTYLFNTPPLIYRACLQNNIKFKMIKGVFLTSHYTYSCGGLQQFFESLTQCSAKYQIFGPSDLTSYMIHNEKIITQTDIYSSIASERSYHSPTINIESIEMANSISYKIIIDIDELRMNSDKMKELSLPSGPWISQVKKEGEATVNGTLIKKSDIFFIKHFHFQFLFLDIHYKSDLQQIPNQEELNSYDLIVHFTSPELLNEEYFSRFTNSKNYCFLNDPILCLKNANEFYENFVKADNSLFPPLIQGHFSSHPNLPPNFESFYSNASISSSTNFNLKKIKAMPTTSPAPLPEFTNYALTIIGSSGAYENPTKSCSSYLLHTHEGFIVIDCGNGFVQQIARKYGNEGLEIILKNLKCVWLSHCHFDHFIGINDLLLLRQKLTNEDLLICCDPDSESEIKEKEKLYGKGDENYFHLFFNNRKEIIQICGLKIESFETIHCECSMGCVITFKNNLRLAYTGDTLFDDKFIDFINHCDVLISEATYPKDKESRCQTYLHMSNTQAEILQIRLNASFLIMVHTSNAYSPEEFIINNKNTIYGFDYLCITDDKIQEIFNAISSVKISI